LIRKGLVMKNSMLFFVSVLIAGHECSGLGIDSFRTAVSTLQSEVHAGVVEILSDSQQSDVDLNTLITRAEFLKSEVCSRLGNSPVDTIQDGDRAYLQKMIDKIDGIIATLEGVDAKKSIAFQAACSELKGSLDY
jgi:hypothetical protein